MPIMYTFYSHKINYKYIYIYIYVLSCVMYASDLTRLRFPLKKSTVDQRFINNYHNFDFNIYIYIYIYIYQ